VATDAWFNTAVGAYSMLGTTGQNNTGVGFGTLQFNTTGAANTAVGLKAMQSNSTGLANTAVGESALVSNGSGNYNTAIGAVAIGNTDYSNTTGLGYMAQVSGNNQVQLGNSTTTVYSYATATRSDARDKADVRPTSLGLAFISSLQPVDFRWDYRDDYRPAMPDSTDPQALAAWRSAGDLSNLAHDGTHARSRFHHGLVAQDVQALIADRGLEFGGIQDHTVNGGDEQLTLGYDEFIAPIIKAIQEQQAQIHPLQATVERQQQPIETQMEQISAQQAQIDDLLTRLSVIEPPPAG